MSHSPKIAVYAGSFDPITNGHLWMIEQSCKIFDKLIVAIGENADKAYTFSLKDRIELIQETTSKIPNVEVTHFKNLFLVDYAKSIGAGFIVRGIRNYTDYDYEKSIRHINSDLSKDITTVFLMPPRNFAEVSSSMVKGLVGSAGWEKIAKKYLPEPVLEKMISYSNKHGIGPL
ncbi:MAG TPA: pantetheine-phosphate adenylyltransferase [Aquella sp.]|nr:pantetheine-phosphate adenylyltransferase [Aquella sp.]